MLTVGLDAQPASITTSRRPCSSTSASRRPRTRAQPDDGHERRVDELAAALRRRGIDDERVLAAMERCRASSSCPGQRGLAYDDAALPIGDGQTMSQPFMVATICELLGARRRRARARRRHRLRLPGRRARRAGRGGRDDRARARARRAARASTLARAGYGRVEVRVGDGTLGVPERAPFDGIAVAAAAPGLPEALYEQLALRRPHRRPGRRPRDQRLELVVRSAEGPGASRARCRAASSRSCPGAAASLRWDARASAGHAARCEGVICRGRDPGPGPLARPPRVGAQPARRARSSPCSRDRPSGSSRSRARAAALRPEPRSTRPSSAHGELGGR